MKHNILLAWEGDMIDAGERDAKWAAIDKAFGIQNVSGQKWEDTAQMTDEQRARNEQELNPSIPKAKKSESDTPFFY